MRRLTILLSAVALVTTACGATQSSEESLSAEDRALAGYFAATYRLQSEQLAATAALMPSAETFEALATGTLDAEDYQQQNLEDTRVIYATWVAGMQALEPPPAAADFHQAQLDSIERVATEQDAIMEDLASPDPAVANQALADFGLLMQDILVETQDLQEQGARLLEDALAGLTDPEARYIIQLLGLRTSESMRQLESFFGGFSSFTGDDPDALLAQLQVGIELLETMAADYRALTPPASWDSLHQEQIALFEDGIELYRELGDLIDTAIFDPASVDIARLQELMMSSMEFAARSPQLSSDLMSGMAAYFESIS